MIQPAVFTDDRGLFWETFNEARYRAVPGLPETFVQDNTSRSHQHVLRGLHFQHKHPQGKLVSVIRGAIFDVAVDIRHDSPTLGRWFGVTLSEHNHTQCWLPPGMAHGFVVLSEIADVVYKCTDYYHPEDEGCLKWDDTELGIQWPVSTPQISAKDALGLSWQQWLRQYGLTTGE